MNLQEVRLLREKVEQLEFNKSWRSKEELVCCGITLAQCQILMELGKTQELCIAELADTLGIDSSTLSRTINRMVDSDLVSRMTKSSDRRYVSLSLTKNGKNLYQVIDDKRNEDYTKIFELIPEHKRKQVMESFEVFIEALRASKKNECSDEMQE
jgi:DNA-binding MarR family transcriptional regulator